jgi:2-(1,2-epoxy-1,2-dihydrophenyl)acetyl-CoA isomerase
MSEPQILSIVSDGVGKIILNRPEAMNAFSDGMREGLLAALSDYGERDDVRCVVITGAGRAFCAGGDITSMAVLQDENDTSVIESRIATSGKILARMRSMPQPIIAAINGPAAGAGMNLALACDMRLASTSAIFAESFVKIGLVPDWGGFGLLPQVVGTAKAMELMMLGDRIDAEEAFRLGVVNKVIPADQFADEVQSLAARLASAPRRALAAIKVGVYLGVRGTAEDVLAYESETQTELFLSADAREGMRAFLEKRRPTFGQG